VYGRPASGRRTVRLGHVSLFFSSNTSCRWHAAGRLWCVVALHPCPFGSDRIHRDVLYELASVGNLPLPLPSPSSAKRERDSDSPVSLQSSTSAGTQPQQQPQPQRVSVSPATSSLGGGSSGAPFTDQLYSHAPEAFAQQPPPDILSHPPQTQTFAYPHLPTHSDELGRVPGHVFHSPAETWLAPAQGHTHRHQPPHQHAAGPIYAQPTASHQATSYGTPQGAEAYTTFVGPALGAAVPASSSPASGQVHDGNVDIWHTMPSGYECVPFPFHSGAGTRVGDWLIGWNGDV
jgi:hypothetical protein